MGMDTVHGSPVGHSRVWLSVWHTGQHVDESRVCVAGRCLEVALGVLLVLAVVILAFLCGRLLMQVRTLAQSVEELRVECQKFDHAIDVLSDREI